MSVINHQRRKIIDEGFMIGIIGAGSWGTALAILLTNNANLTSIPIWDREPISVYLSEKIIVVKELTDLLQQVKDLLIVVPSRAFTEVILKIKPYLTSEHRIAWATKGLEPETGDFLSQFMQKELGKNFPIAVLSGPSFATEVANGMPTSVTIASNNKKFLQDMSSYFHINTFRIYPSDDLIGVQLGGVVKNVLAVAIGISDGLGFGANTRAALLTRGLAEMQALGQKLGAKADTLYGLAGLGDVVLTCLDNQSRNRRFGLAIAAGKSIEDAKREIGQEIEAISNVANLCNKANILGVELPISQQIEMILNNTITLEQAVDNLIGRKQKWKEFS